MRIREAFEFFQLVAIGVVIGSAALVLVGAYAAIIPIRWMVDNAAKLKAEGVRWNS